MPALGSKRLALHGAEANPLGPLASCPAAEVRMRANDDGGDIEAVDVDLACATAAAVHYRVRIPIARMFAEVIGAGSVMDT